MLVRRGPANGDRLLGLLLEPQQLGLQGRGDLGELVQPVDIAVQ